MRNSKHIIVAAAKPLGSLCLNLFFSCSIRLLRFWVLILCASTMGCGEEVPDSLDNKVAKCAQETEPEITANEGPAVKGALLSTRFHSFEELKSSIQVESFNTESKGMNFGKPWSRLIHCSNGREVTSVLESGVSERDFAAARDGGFWSRIWLLLRSPYAVVHRKDLQVISILARRRPDVFGEGDPAFYDISETMMTNMKREEKVHLNSQDLSSEKGYFNTINHITAQVFMTAFFSERLADFVADAHERKNMPELVSGKFSEAQMQDLETGPVDNYVDMINNEWGQELGKLLKEKYKIDRDTHWTPELLSNFLNDIQGYYSWAFQVGFEPFRPEDGVVTKFVTKVNRVMNDLSGL